MEYFYDENDYVLLLSKTKYSIEIVRILKENRQLTHGDLCGKLKISKNNLSNIIKKIEPFDIVIVNRIGKNVYYNISPKGLEFEQYCDEKVFEISKSKEKDKSIFGLPAAQEKRVSQTSNIIK